MNKMLFNEKVPKGTWSLDIRLTTEIRVLLYYHGTTIKNRISRGDVSCNVSW